MRYVFTFIGVMIVLRTFSWLRKDRRLKHKRLKQLPDAGTVGVLTVVTGNRQLREGMIIPVPHEGLIGSVRTCDIVVPLPGVALDHADFTFVDGKGLYVLPRRGCQVTVDGQLLRNAAEGKRCPMQHGSILEIGEAVLQLGVFAGLDVKVTQIEPWYGEPEPAAPLPFWQRQQIPPPAESGQTWPEYPPPEQPWQDAPPQMTRPSQGVPVPPMQPGQPPYGAQPQSGPYSSDPRSRRPFPWMGGDADEP